jgi:hypothetical protein
MSRGRRDAVLAATALLLTALIVVLVYVGSVAAGKKGVGQATEMFALSVGSGPAQIGYAEASEEEEAWGPWSFTVLKNGNVAILDAVNQRLLVVSPAGEELQSVAYEDLGLVSPVDLCEWRGRLAIAECNTSPEAVVLVDLDHRRRDGQVELPDGLAEAGPRFLMASDGGLQLVLGMTESHRVTDSNKGHDLAKIKKAEPAVDLPGVGSVTVAPASDPAKGQSAIRLTRTDERGKAARTVKVDDIRAERVEPLGSTQDGDLLAATAYFVDAGKGVQVKFYVEKLSRADLGTSASVTVPTEEFYLWPERYLAVDQQGRIWCMVAQNDKVSFRILELASERPDVRDGSLARSINSLVQRVGGALGGALSPAHALADTDPPARSNPWTRANGQSVAVSYGYLTWTCSSGAYYRSCNLADNIRPRNIYVGGVFTGVSYGWGKWTTPSTFKSSVEAGTYDAGDIGSTTVEPCVVGTDCSGLVSRIWGLSSKHSTTTLPAHAVMLADGTSLGSLAFGDVFDRTVSPGRHVLCFNAYQGVDTFYCCEATTRNNVDRVVFWTRSKSELLANSYHMYRYRYWTN